VNTSRNALDRFLVAQAADHAVALAELQRGRKQSHWIWYVLPQLRGLGTSSMSHEYGISGPEEARLYLEHAVLGPRLRECVAAICAHTDKSAVDILGRIDALKFWSCLTLFAAVSQDSEPFIGALRQFFDGQRDPKTLELLAAAR
jgi:uncharacterized protein (DUF1810 family)